jgi:hypothetical protein
MVKNLNQQNGNISCTVIILLKMNASNEYKNHISIGALFAKETFTRKKSVILYLLNYTVIKRQTRFAKIFDFFNIKIFYLSIFTLLYTVKWALDICSIYSNFMRGFVCETLE